MARTPKGLMKTVRARGVFELSRSNYVKFIESLTDDERNITQDHQILLKSRVTVSNNVTQVNTQIDNIIEF